MSSKMATYIREKATLARNAHWRCTVDPSKLRLELKIPNGQAVELRLFEALLSYAHGIPVIIVVGKGWMLHGDETCKLIAAGETAVNCRVVYLGDDQVGHGFNAEDCDWPEILEAARQNFMKGSPRSDSYVAWLKHEITKRGGDASSAA